MSELEDLKARLAELESDLAAVPQVAAARRARKDAAERVEHERIRALPAKARAAAIEGLAYVSLQRLIQPLDWREVRDLLAGLPKLSPPRKPDELIEDPETKQEHWKRDSRPKIARERVEDIVNPMVLEVVRANDAPLRPYSKMTSLITHRGQPVPINAAGAGELRALGRQFAGRVTTDPRDGLSYLCWDLTTGDGWSVPDDVLAVVRKYDRRLDAWITDGKVILQPLDEQACRGLMIASRA